MLRAIKLKNFQAHRTLVIKFSKGITTIKGPTDVGKSAIIRAIRWAALNDFAGDDFIHWGSKSASVKLLVDGVTVTRRKGESGNVYKIGKKVYRAFGKGVPEPVAKLLALNKENFQGQFAPHFWIANTASQVSRDLNKVVDLTIIDSSLKNIATQVRNAQSRHTVAEERLGELRDQFKVLRDQRGRVEDFERIKEAHNELERIKTAGDHLERLLADASACQPGDRIQKAEQGEAVVSCFRSALSSAARHQRLAGLISIYREFAGRSEPPDFSAIEEAHETLQDLEGQDTELQKAIEDLEQAEFDYRASSREADQSEKVLHKLLKGRCPVCRKPL